MSKKVILFFIVGVISIFFVGISFSSFLGGDRAEDSSLKGDQNKKSLSVVASFYPLFFIAQYIGGDHAEVINISGSSDVHSYTLTPGDMTTMINSNLAILQGENLELWAKDFIPELEKKGVKTLVLLERLDISENRSKDDGHIRDSKSQNDSNDSGSHDHEDGDSHDHDGIDPHTWLDPVLAQNMVDFIEQEFSQIDPDHAPLYKDNAQQLKDRFQEVHREYVRVLGSCHRNEVIVSHNAFGYIAERYGFITHPIAGLSTLDEPSAKLLSQLQQEAKEGMTHVLTEEGNVERYAETLARETGLTLLSINPLGRGTLNENKDFFDVIHENLQAFALALDCTI